MLPFRKKKRTRQKKRWWGRLATQWTRSRPTAPWRVKRVCTKSTVVSPELDFVLVPEACTAR